jgi:hypothetical protein
LTKESSDPQRIGNAIVANTKESVIKGWFAINVE